MIAIPIVKVKTVQTQFEDELKAQYSKALLRLKKLKTSTSDDKKYLREMIRIFRGNPNFITMLPSEIEDIKENLPEIPIVEIDGKHKKSSIKNRIILGLGYKELRSSFYPKYFREIGIKTCVYCNSQLTVTAQKPKGGWSAKFDVDHNLSKDEYPLLSICLFNLFPSCAPCNRNKGNSVFDFNLYSNELTDLKQSKLQFRLSTHSKAKYLTTRSINDLEVVFKDYPNAKLGLAKKFNEKFQIEGIYETQKDLVKELLIKKQIYNPTYLKLLRLSFNKIPINSQLFNRLLVGNYTEDKELHKRPMSKMMMDIARQLELIQDKG